MVKSYKLFLFLIFTASHSLISSPLLFPYLCPMNGVQLHFLFNHMPMFLALFALILWVVNFFKPTAILKNLAMIIMVVMGLMSFAAMATGEEAEEVMEQWDERKNEQRPHKTKRTYPT